MSTTTFYLNQSATFLPPTQMPQFSSDLHESVAQLPDKLLIFSMIQRGFLTICFSLVVVISPTLFTTVLRLTEVSWHLRICYAANILNSFCYMFTFAMNQPNLLMPSSFALFRGALRNRFGAVSLAISFANLISGVIVTIGFRVFIEYPFSKRQRFIFGTLPYALLHLTAILPALVYIILTMNFMDEEHISRENLTVFVGREWLFHSGSVYYFPRTPLSAVYSLAQVGSFLVAGIFSLVICARQLKQKTKHGFQTTMHLISLILTILLPWSVIFGVIYLKPLYGMEVVTIAFIVTFFYPLLEIIAIINYVGSFKRLFKQNVE